MGSYLIAPLTPNRCPASAQQDSSGKLTSNSGFLECWSEGTCVRLVTTRVTATQIPFPGGALVYFSSPPSHCVPLTQRQDYSIFRTSKHRLTNKRLQLSCQWEHESQARRQPTSVLSHSTLSKTITASICTLTPGASPQPTPHAGRI